jgi:hypothetical protein
MAKKVCTAVGVVFLLVGLAGFAMPGLLGAHLSPVHNVVHLLSGAAALYLGLKGSESAARGFCWAFGAVYLLLGVAGFVAGSPGTASVPAGMGADDRLLVVIPGQLELATVDHLIHVALGLVFLVAGLLSKPAGRA